MIKTKINNLIFFSKTINFFFIVVVVFIFSTSLVFAKEINLKNIVSLVNKSRVANNINPVFISPILIKIANDKAHDMFIHNYFAHTSPQGIDPWYWFKKNNYIYEYAGENLAINYTTAEEQHQAWMNSLTHRKNILNKNYTEIGIATESGYINNQKAFVTVQVFGKPQLKNISSMNTNYSNNPIKTSLALNDAQIQYPQQTFYLTNFSKKITPPKEKFISPKNEMLFFSEKNKQNLLWLIILILGIIIMRDLVLNTINNSSFQKHSTTNLILLLMLWSILIGL
ncbi:MAG TPA: CAP domain-containing protein [Candidatus Moranbacteria bacterium]|nr:CAP domain-containing protein [Candidatus Moranbacteria bacterium]